jgi:hypothetical protein
VFITLIRTKMTLNSETSLLSDPKVVAVGGEDV